MLLVGLTGGIGSGKSTFARMLAARGAIVVDADDLARRALEPGTRGFKQVCDLFGDEILTPERTLDRAAIGRVVFADESKRRALESITHPEVFRLLAGTVETHRDTDAVVVFDAPLIIETGFDEAADVLIVVTASEAVQVERLSQDRGMNRDEARRRIAAQVSPEHREAAADILVDNEGDLASLERRADEVWSELRSRAASPESPDESR